MLARELPERGTVLEIASGTGEHALFMAPRFPQLQWQPSDFDPGSLASIAAWQHEAELANLLAPVHLDASEPDWPIARCDAILCVNMVHISPWEASEGLMRGAGRLLGGDAPLCLYGPYLEKGVETAASNLAFDASLKARNAAWGLRDASAIDGLAEAAGLVRTARYDMPANNIMLIFRKR